MPKNLLDLSRLELEAFLVEDVKEPRFRAAQLWQWLWQKGAADFAAMTNVSKALREKLARVCEIRWPEIEREQTSRDGTVKLLLGLADGAFIETVLMRAGSPSACTPRWAAPWPAPSATPAAWALSATCPRPRSWARSWSAGAISPSAGLRP
jgi:hypothetical protein